MIINNENEIYENYKICPKCGAKVLNNNRFCTKCGYALNSEGSKEKIENYESSNLGSDIASGNVSGYSYYTKGNQASENIPAKSGNKKKSYVVAIVILSVLLVAAVAGAIYLYYSRQTFYKAFSILEESDTKNKEEIKQLTNERDTLKIENDELKTENEKITKQLNVSKTQAAKDKSIASKNASEVQEYHDLINSIRNKKVGWASSKFYTEKPVIVLKKGQKGTIPVVCKYYSTQIWCQGNGLSASADWSAWLTDSKINLNVKASEYTTGLTTFDIYNDSNSDRYQIIVIVTD